ncbi:MAG: LysR family transcriptional regulator [Acidimicrobiales bacterium]
MNGPGTPAQLEALVVLARCGSVTGAARELGLSQPAVSHQLRGLEQALGLAVTERMGRGLRLTEAGRALVPAAGSALAALRAVGEVAAAHRGLRAGRLSIAASNTVGVYRLPGWIGSFLERYPDLEVSTRLVNTATAVRLLRAAVVDCALVEGPCPTEDLEVLALDWDELGVVAAAAHPLAGLARVGGDDLAGHRYLSREAGSGTEALASELLGSAYGRGPVLELPNVGAVHQGVLAGLGYAVLPTVAVAGDLDQGRVVTLRLDRPHLRRELTALRRPYGHGPPLQALWGHFVGIAAGAGSDGGGHGLDHALLEEAEVGVGGKGRRPRV